MGQSTCTSGVVGQLGIEMIPLWPSRSAALTSGTTRGTSGSMRQAALSSMTIAPVLTPAGISCLGASVVAEKKATSTPAKEREFASSTSHSHSPTVSLRPAERLEAKRRSSLMGKRLWSAIFKNSWPTRPVAPTTATLYCLDIPRLILLSAARGDVATWYRISLRGGNVPGWLEPAPEPHALEADLGPVPEKAGLAQDHVRLRFGEEAADGVGGLAVAGLQEAGALPAECPVRVGAARDLAGDVAGDDLSLAVSEDARLREHHAVGQGDGSDVPNGLDARSLRGEGLAVALHPTAGLGQTGGEDDVRDAVDGGGDEEVEGGVCAVFEPELLRLLVDALQADAGAVPDLAAGQE